MSKTFEAIRQLVASGEFRISNHGYDELAEDDIRVRDLVDGLADATVVEDYPDFPKGPAVLVLRFDSREQQRAAHSRRVGYPEASIHPRSPGHSLSP